MGFIHQFRLFFVNHQIVFMLLLLRSDNKFSVLSFCAKIESLEDNDKEFNDNDKLKIGFPNILGLNSAASKSYDLSASNTIESTSPSSSGDNTLAQADEFKYKNYDEIGHKTQPPDFNVNELNLDKTKDNDSKVSAPKFIKFQNTDENAHHNTNEIKQWLREHKNKKINANNPKPGLLETLSSFLSASNAADTNSTHNSNIENDVMTKVLAIPSLQKILSPCFNGYVSKLLPNITIEDNLKELEEKQKDLQNKINKITEKNHNRKQLHNKTIKKIKNIEETYSNNNEGLINRLMLIKEFVDSIPLKREDSTGIFRDKQKMINSTDNTYNDYDNETTDKVMDFVNGYQHKLKNWFGSLMKDVFENNYNISFTENNDMMKNFKRLFHNNTDSTDYNNERLHNRQKNLQDLHRDSVFLNLTNNKYLNKGHNLNNNIDKYLAHNLVQLSNNRKDREYPVELFHLSGRALPDVKNQINSVNTKTD